MAARRDNMVIPFAAAGQGSSIGSGSEIHPSDDSGDFDYPKQRLHPESTGFAATTAMLNPAFSGQLVADKRIDMADTYRYGSDSYSSVTRGQQSPGGSPGMIPGVRRGMGASPGPRRGSAGAGMYDARRLSDDDEDYEDGGYYAHGGDDGGTVDDVYDDDEDDDDDEEPLALKKKRKPPIVHRWNWIPILLFLWFIGSSVYYFYVRWGFLTHPYAIFVFVMEIVGWTSFMPYAVLITRGVYPTGSPGLPAAGSPEEEEQAWWTSPSKGGNGFDSINGTPLQQQRDGQTPQAYGSRNPDGLGPTSPAVSIPETSYFMYRFHVRVLIPCYKEDLAVVASTVQAALSADLPALTRRTVYLCDDGKDPEKQSFVEGLRLSGEDIVYVTGRIRKKGEVNGKSANLNNCLRNVVYKNYPKNDNGEIDWTEISNKECIVIFDADMNCKPDFFLKELEVMVDDEIALLLTPQAFYNIDTDMDIFNAINAQFWEYWLPGAFGWGYIACTGTNFMIRARALCHAGFFPTYTITEDYALGMELKARGYKATYLSQYLAVGEAPEEARNVFQQRSRWTKGHYQVFFSGVNALLNMQLPFFQRLWYTYAAWAPFCTALTTPVFMLVPFMSIVFGLNPVSITFEFVLASTIYFCSLQAVQNYCTSWSHVKLMWYVNVSNTVLWFTYVKAFFNTLLLKVGAKVATFKATTKTKAIDGSAAPPPPAPLPGAPLSSVPEGQALLSADGGSGSHAASQPSASAAQGGGAPTSMMGRLWARMTPRKSAANTPTSKPPPPKEEEYAYPVRVGRETPVKSTPRARLLGSSEYSAQSGVQPAVPAGLMTPGRGGGTVTPPRPMSQRTGGYTQLPASYQDAEVAPVRENEVSGWERLKAIARTFKPENVTEFGKMMDPLALLLMWMFNLGTVGVGLWQLIGNAERNTTSDFMFDSPLKGNPYLIISTAWAFYNSMSPYLFLHYCVTSGASFKFMVKVIMLVSNFVMAGAIIIVWLMIPTNFEVGAAADSAASYYYPSSIPNDTNTNYLYVWGKEGSPIPEELLLSSGLVVPELNDTMRRLLADQPPLVDLMGGLLMNDHVKYAMPIAYSVSMLAWALLKFPAGISDGRPREGLMQTLRAGADFLMRSYIELPDGTSVYVAQVGDGADYVYYAHEGYDPVARGSLWTSPAQDPYLSGDVPRKVWLMTAAGIGADLMSQAAAALASTSIVFKNVDEDFSTRLLATSEKVYQFATLRADNPSSYCEFMPCTVNVTYTKEVMAHEYEAPPPNEPVCYYMSWVDKVCYVSYSTDKCTATALEQKEVFRTRDACCNAMDNTGMWDGLQSKKQGICAVPANQTYCYVPDVNLRTCFLRVMNPLTGEGKCQGPGIEVYPSTQTCCQYLLAEGHIDAAQGNPGTGLCSRVSQDANFTECYVPVLNNATCVRYAGSDCSGFGIDTVFDGPEGCCNDLITTMQRNNFNKPGGIQMQPAGVCELFYNEQTGPPVRRSLLGRVADLARDTASAIGSAARRLSQTDSGVTITIGGGTSAPPPRAQIPIENSSYWLPIGTVARSQCANNKCRFILVNDWVEVPLFNSTSVLDDMAWAATWMYKATNNTLYMGQAQKFVARHYKEDVSLATMVKDRTYYRSDWNNVIWNVNVMLTELTGKKEFRDKVELMLKTWVFGDSINLKSPLPPATAVVNIANITSLRNFTDARNQTYVVVPECTPTSDFELNCYDGVDNNCNGKVDRDDEDCGLFPVQYTPNQLAFGGYPAGPLAANAALTGIMYGVARGGDSGRRLRCWALNQVAYLAGSIPGQDSLVVGVGTNPPKSVQHRASSCPRIYSEVNESYPNVRKVANTLVPEEVRKQLSSAQQTLFDRPRVDTNEPPCNWDNAFYPSTANPSIDMVKGALVAGPESYYPFSTSDIYSRERMRNSMSIGLHNSVGLTAAIMGLVETDTTIRSCELFNGIYQKYTQAGII